jgi:hypothetical protein
MKKTEAKNSHATVPLSLWLLLLAELLLLLLLAELLLLLL